MKKIISLITLLTLFVVGGCKNEPANNNQNPEPQPQVHNYKALFQAEPSSVSAAGGDGSIIGTLQELSQDGKIESEKPLKPNEYTLKLIAGDKAQITLDEKGKTFSIVQGDPATFELEAYVTSGVAKGQKQKISIMRAGTITYTFDATPNCFAANGGKGTVTGKRIITDAEGKTIEEKVLEAKDFSLSLTSSAKGIRIDAAAKTFVVEEGNAAEFELEVAAEGSAPQKLRIRREGTLTFSFEAKPASFSAKGGEGVVLGKQAATDGSGKVVEEKVLAAKDFSLTLKEGNASEITIDANKKSFTIAKGTKAAAFTLEAKPHMDGATATQLTIHRKAGETPNPNPEIMLPLNYVAEYNVAQDGISFATSQANNASGYFTWDDAVAKFSNITIAGKSYHMPSREEWYAIAPNWVGKRPYIVFDTNGVEEYKDKSETVVVNGETITSTNDYYSEGGKVCYAIRFKGTKYHSAWVYSYADNQYGGGKILIVLARPIEEGSEVTIKDIMTNSFWDKDKDKDVLRVFPACGSNTSGTGQKGDMLTVGEYGYYWAGTSDYKGYYFMGFNMQFAYTSFDGYYKFYGRSIRLFETRTK